MAKPNYTRRAFTALAAGAVLTMLLLATARPALADASLSSWWASWGPTIDVPANNSYDNDGDIVFAGPGFYDMLGMNVDLYEDLLPEGPNKVGTGTVWGIGLDCEAGCYYDSIDWSISLTGVADGTHTYYAVVTDFDGNVSAPSSTVTVVVDRSIPPTVDYFMPSPDGVTTQGPVGGVTLRMNAAGNPYYEYTPWLPNSVSAYFSKKVDPNTLTPSTFTLVKNESDGSSTPVDATVGYEPTRYNWVYLKLPSFLEEATNYTATVRGGPDGVKDEFGIPLAEDYVWSFTTATWPTVGSVSPSDEAKEVTSSTDVEATFSKDIVVTPSTFTLVKNESDGSTTPVDATVYSGIKYYNGIATKTATLNPSSNLQATTKYTATLKGGPDGVKDTAGNPLAEDYAWSFTTTSDVTPPETSIVSGSLPNPSDNTPTFSFSGSDDVSAIAKLQYSYQVDGGIFLSGGWRWWSDYSGQTSVTLSSLSDGGHVFSVRAKDEAGNVDETPASYSWTVDTVAPTAPSISGPADNTLTKNNKPTINGTADAGSTVTVYDGSTNLGTANADSTGIWSYTPSSALSDGRHSLTAKATDAAGNTSSASDPAVSVSIDTAAPTVSSVSPSENATGVALDASVSVTFSEEVKNIGQSTFILADPNGQQVSATVNYDSASKSATLDLSSNLQENTKYKATLKGGANGAKDTAGNPLAADKVWSFTTAGVTSPKVTDFSPTGTGVGRDTDVKAKFSEDADGVTADTFMLANGASEPTPETKITSGTTVSYDPATHTATLNPYGSSSGTRLEKCQRYTAKVTTGVKDKAGNPLAVDKVWSFKTGRC